MKYIRVPDWATAVTWHAEDGQPGVFHTINSTIEIPAWATHYTAEIYFSAMHGPATIVEEIKKNEREILRRERE